MNRLTRSYLTTRLLTSALPLTMALAAGLPTVIAPPAAHAQILVGGPGGAAGGPRMSRVSLDRYMKILGLDDAQKDAVVALHEAYSEGQKSASKEMSAKMKEVEADLKDGDMEVIHEKIPAIMEAHGKKAGELEQTLLDDIKSVLTPQQMESNWPKVDRLRRREQWLRTGVLSGSNVDLTQLVEDMKLPESERGKLNETLNAYEQDMDRVLSDVQQAHDARGARGEAPGRGRRTAGGGGRMMMTFDGESMRDHVKAQREESTKVKEVNQRYARMLASELPEELRGKLEEQYKFASFKQIYRDGPTARKLAAAEKLGDLSPEQQTRLRELADNYRRQSRAANDRWATAQEQAEAAGKVTGGGGMGMVFNMNDGGQPDELKEARQLRRDLDQRVDADVDSLLNDDQKSRLPKPQTVRRGMGQDFDVLTDGEHGTVVVSAIETADESEDGEGVIVSRSVIVTSGGEPADEKEPKKDDPKPK